MIGPNRILLVDDSTSARLALARLFRRSGYEVEEAENETAALSVATSFQPHLVLLAVKLSAAPDFDRLRSLRADPVLGRGAMVLLSRTALSPEQQAGAAQAGADGWVSRRWGNAELLTRVALYVRQQELAERLRASEAREREMSGRQSGAAGAELDPWQRLLFESNPLPLWIFDVETLRFLAVNDAAVARYGYTRAEFLGMTIKDIRPPEDVPALLKNVAQLTTGFSRSGMWRHRLKDGTIIRVEIVGHVIEYGGRRAELVVANDVSERLRAETALRESELFLQMAFRIGRVGAWRVDLPARTYRWSDSIREIVELAPDVQPAFEQLFDFFAPEDREAARAVFEDCARDGRPFIFEAGLTTARGRHRWVRILGEAVRDSHGVIERVQGAFQDVTELKEAADSLAESQRRFRLLADSIPFIVWTAGPDGTVDYNNRHFFAYTGMAMDAPAATNWQPCVHPEDLMACLGVWSECVQTEQPYEVEMRLRRGADGSYRWFRVQAKAVRDVSGRLVKWYGTGIDIDETKRLEQLASGMARRLTTTLESLTDGFVTLDHMWRFTYVNAEAERLFRRSRHEMLGAVVWALFPELAGGNFERECRRAWMEKIAVSREEFFKPLARWIDVRAFPSEEGVAVVFRDVTQRRQDSEQLRLQNAALVAASDSISVTNRAGRIEWVNPAFAKKYGYRQEEILGRTPGELVKSGRHEQAFYAEMWRTILAGRVWSSEIINRRKDGSLLTEDIAITPIRDGEGRVKHFVAIKRDITARKQAEEKLREQAALLDQAQDAILVRDLAHQITYWNKGAERLYGWSAAEAIGRTVTDLICPDAASFEKAWGVLLERNEWSGEIGKVHRSGRNLVVASRWTLVRDAAGQPWTVLVIDTDITEKKRLEAKFLRAQRLESIGTLAGGIAHDLNNALAPILIAVELFRLDETNPDRLSLLNNIEKSAQHGAALVRQVLSFARGMEGTFAEVNLRHLTRDLQDIIRDTFPKNIAFRLELARDLWPVIADATQLNQVLMNLVVNARDAMPDGGNLTLSLRNVILDESYVSMNPEANPGDYVRIDVTDSGEGIPPAIRDRIFEPFFTTKEVGKGTGLGLATVLSIVKGHGGFIDLYSEVGRGTRFSVFLPTGGSPRSVPGRAADQSPLPRGHGELVLVVDDHESVRNVARQTLERFGYRVLLAANGAEAVARYAQHRTDVAVVLTDIAMPVMDGNATIVALQAMDPAVRIIASSGLAREGNPAKVMSAAGLHFMPKPYTTEALLRVLAEVLAPPDASPPPPDPGE
jgi:PAS domain S-box-containing protein